MAKKQAPRKQGKGASAPQKRKRKPARRPAPATRAGLNPRQQRFVAEYLKDLNATQAAIRAGYSKKTAYSLGQRLLKHAEVAAAVAAGQAKTAKKLEITKEMIVDELRKIAFADLRKAVAWGPTQQTSVDKDGQRVISNGVTLVDSSELDADTAAAVAEVGNTREGVKIKLHDKQRALGDLAKMLGFMVEKHEHTGANGGPIETRAVNMTPQERQAEIKRLLTDHPHLAAIVAAQQQET